MQEEEQKEREEVERHAREEADRLARYGTQCQHAMAVCFEQQCTLL